MHVSKKHVPKTYITGKKKCQNTYPCMHVYTYVCARTALWTYVHVHNTNLGIDTYLLHGAGSLRSQQVFSLSRNSSHFIEPEGSSPQSQVPATCPYSQPARSSPYPHIPLPGDPSSYYPTIYAWVSQVLLTIGIDTKIILEWILRK